MTGDINYLTVSRFIADLEYKIREFGIYQELRTCFGNLSTFDRGVEVLIRNTVR